MVKLTDEQRVLIEKSSTPDRRSDMDTEGQTTNAQTECQSALHFEVDIRHTSHSLTGVENARQL